MKYQRVRLIVLTFMIISCSPNYGANDTLISYEETIPLFGKTVTVNVCYDLSQKKSLKSAYKAVWSRLEGINWRMNAEDTRSDIYLVNHSKGHPVQVGSDTYQVLQEAMNMYYFSIGTFDITIRPFMELLRRGEQATPYCFEEKFKEDIEKIKPAVGMKNVQLLPDRQVKLLNPQTRIDLGGIAKGYAVDEAVRILREFGFFNFYVNVGGDAYASGHDCQNKPWRIEIRNPMDQREIIDVVEIKDSAISTSDNYNNYYKIGYDKYSKIIPPDVGYKKIREWSPTTARMVVSMTIIAPVGIRADALATMSRFFENNQWKKLIDTWEEGYAGLRVFPSDETTGERFVKTKWWEKYSVMKQPRP
jgi:FAD:protein FMN transferase